jgi:plastocyanin
MRFPNRLYLIPAGALGIVLAVLPAIAGSVPNPTIDAVNAVPYGHYWSPAQAVVATGGTVTVRNMTTVEHGVNWVGGPAQPECSSGVPVGKTTAAAGREWSGTCTFAQAGTYTFYCTIHGPEMTGTITVATPGAPIATTGAAGAVDKTEATLNGTVDRQEKPTTYYFNYGKTASYGEATKEESLEEGSGNQSVSAHIGSLSPGTTYHFQVVAKNTAGTTVGVDRTFTTEFEPGAPIAATGSATALGETEATLQGTVNPDGEATTYLFEWGASDQYGQTTAELPAGEDHFAHAESAQLTGLTAGTVYHFRLLAKNALGTMPGTDQTLTTESPLPPSPSPTTTNPPAPMPAPSPTTAVPPARTTSAVEPPSGSPPIGSPALRTTQHGTSVRGSLEVAADGAGGRLEVDLLAGKASIAKAAKPSASVIVGRLVRTPVAAGRATFVVRLDAKARSALGRRRRLALTVKIVFTPKDGHAVTVARSVVLNR